MSKLLFFPLVSPLQKPQIINLKVTFYLLFRLFHNLKPIKTTHSVIFFGFFVPFVAIIPFWSGLISKTMQENR